MGTHRVITDDAGEKITVKYDGEFAIVHQLKMPDDGGTKVVMLNEKEATDLADFIIQELYHAHH